LLEAVVGKTAPDAAQSLAKTLEELPPGDKALAAPVVATLLELLGPGHSAHVAVAGVPNLASFDASFQSNLRPLLQALEEQVVLLRLLGEASGEELTIRIGQENTAEGFHG